MERAELEKEINELKVRLSVDEQKLQLVFSQATEYRRLSDVALDKAEARLDARLETMNEIRQQLDRQASTFATVEGFDAFKQQASAMINQSAERLEGIGKVNASRIAALESARTESITRDTFDNWKKENDMWKTTVAPVRDVQAIEESVNKINISFNQVQGALRLVQFAGAAGIISLVIVLLRMMGLVR